MSQVDLPTSIGYQLKRASAALRAAMDAELRHCDLSVPQYASLELLAQRPGLTNADLARGVFVTRQATHQFDFDHLVVSFCGRCDKSGQWLHYGHSGRGVALGFSSAIACSGA